MSLALELQTLQRRRETLKEDLKTLLTTLEQLYAQRAPLLQKAEDLSNRTSSLAKTLLQQVQKEIDKLNQQISQAEKKQENTEKEIAQIQLDITTRENDTSLYIKTQSSEMISTFFEYIRNHLEELGGEFKKTFHIKEVTKYTESYIYGIYYPPTGNIGIYDESKKSFIVTSKDFYFKQTLSACSRGPYNETYIHLTDWYKNYRDCFFKQLVETLKKEYPYGKSFKLTIEQNSSITLELV